MSEPDPTACIDRSGDPGRPLGERCSRCGHLGCYKYGCDSCALQLQIAMLRPAEPAAPAEAAPHVSDRGFRGFAVAGRDDEVVEIFESSLASGPHVWLQIGDPTMGEGSSASAQLSLDAVREVRDRLDWFLAHHYQLREHP